MKITELRIGNLFKWKGHIHNVEGIIRWGKEEIHLNRTQENDEAFICKDITEFVPIPITKEWFLIFGFTPDNNNLVFDHPLPATPEDEHKDLGKKYPAFFFNNRLNKWMDCHTRVCIEYVHQLQNLYFTLNGEELTIKQPKADE